MPVCASELCVVDDDASAWEEDVYKYTHAHAHAHTLTHIPSSFVKDRIKKK